MEKIAWRRTKAISDPGYLNQRLRKRVSREVSCRKEEVDGVVKDYEERGYKFEKNRRKHGMCFLSFSKSV